MFSLHPRRVCMAQGYGGAVELALVALPLCALPLQLLPLLEVLDARFCGTRPASCGTKPGSSNFLFGGQADSCSDPPEQMDSSHFLLMRDVKIP